MKQKYDITGMSCSACSSRVEKCVSRLDGMDSVSVNLLTNSMQVEYNEDELTSEQIIQAVEQAGYGASQEDKTDNSNHNSNDKSNDTAKYQNVFENQAVEMKKRLIISLTFLIPLMYLSMGHNMWGAPLPQFLCGTENAVSFAFTQFLLALPVIYVNRIYYKRGFGSFLHRSPNMDTLIAVGSAASMIYGVFAIYRMSYGIGIGDMDVVMQYQMDLYFESAVMILTLVTLGKYMETRSKGKTGEALNKLIDMSPKTAMVERDGTIIEVPADQVNVGEIVVVKPGSVIPVDGVVIEGRSGVDESAITGESIPVEKETGSNVVAATINQNGYIKVEVQQVGVETAFSKIIKLVEEASATKAPIAKLADKIAGVFVPVVMTIALITAIVWLLMGSTFEFALSCAICVLVISCPCALGLATPVAIMVGTGKAAENGILVKSGEALQAAHDIDYVVLDKTGTITAGEPVVTDVLAFGMTDKELLAYAGKLEEKSEHPLASSIMTYINEQKIVFQSEVWDSFDVHAGKGIASVKDGVRYLAGNSKLLDEYNINIKDNIDVINDLAVAGKTPMLFAKGDKLIGIIAVADIVKPTSAQAIQDLRDMNIDVVMLTGDNKRTAKGIATSLNLTDVIAEVLPQDKERVIARLQDDGHRVAMVGDGINDAPALVRSNVGIAIGAGTDVAIESADIVLIKNDLLDVASAIRLSRQVIRNIKENLFWAFFYNCLGIPLAAGVFYNIFGWKLSPMIGAAAMSFSSVFVVSNALRLKLFKTYINKITDQTSKKQEDNTMRMKIEGMMCQNCVKHVKNALESFDGVKAYVSLENNEAVVEMPESVIADELKKAVEDEGYKVTEIIK